MIIIVTVSRGGIVETYGNVYSTDCGTVPSIIADFLSALTRDGHIDQSTEITSIHARA